MPRVKLTKTARISLYVLMGYLACLMALLGVKFMRVLRTPKQTAMPVPSAADASVQPR